MRVFLVTENHEIDRTSNYHLLHRIVYLFLGSVILIFSWASTPIAMAKKKKSRVPMEEDEEEQVETPSQSSTNQNSLYEVRCEFIGVLEFFCCRLTVSSRDSFCPKYGMGFRSSFVIYGLSFRTVVGRYRLAIYSSYLCCCCLIFNFKRRRWLFVLKFLTFLWRRWELVSFETRTELILSLNGVQMKKKREVRGSLEKDVEEKNL